MTSGSEKKKAYPPAWPCLSLDLSLVLFPSAVGLQPSVLSRCVSGVMVGFCVGRTRVGEKGPYQFGQTRDESGPFFTDRMPAHPAASVARGRLLTAVAPV